MQKVVLQPFDSSLAEAAGVTLRFEYSDKKNVKKRQNYCGECILSYFCNVRLSSEGANDLLLQQYSSWTFLTPIMRT